LRFVADARLFKICVVEAEACDEVIAWTLIACADGIEWSVDSCGQGDDENCEAGEEGKLVGLVHGKRSFRDGLFSVLFLYKSFTFLGH